MWSEDEHLKLPEARNAQSVDGRVRIGLCAQCWNPASRSGLVNARIQSIGWQRGSGNALNTFRPNLTAASAGLLARRVSSISSSACFWTQMHGRPAVVATGVHKKGRRPRSRVLIPNGDHRGPMRTCQRFEGRGARRAPVHRSECPVDPPGRRLASCFRAPYVTVEPLHPVECVPAHDADASTRLQQTRNGAAPMHWPRSPARSQSYAALSSTSAMLQRAAASLLERSWTSSGSICSGAPRSSTSMRTTGAKGSAD